jgi:hypothetical protein
MPYLEPPVRVGDRVIVMSAYKVKERPLDVCGRRLRIVYRCPLVVDCPDCAPYLTTQLPIGEVMEVIQWGGYHADGPPAVFYIAVRLKGSKWWAIDRDVRPYTVIEEIGSLGLS